VAFVHAIRADRGARSYQEDAAAVRAHAGGLAAVLADGMGGHAGGAVASEVASAGFLDAFLAGTGDEGRVESHLLVLLGLANEAQLGGDRRNEAFAAWRRYPVVSAALNASSSRVATLARRSVQIGWTTPPRASIPS